MNVSNLICGHYESFGDIPCIFGESSKNLHNFNTPPPPGYNGMFAKKTFSNTELIFIQVFLKERKSFQDFKFVEPLAPVGQIEVIWRLLLLLQGNENL